MTRLRWHNLARAARTVLACAALATCSPDATAPGGRVESALDLASLLRAPGDLPIPIDAVVVELRRTSDSSLAGAPRTIQINPANQSDTALRVTVQVDMSRDQEDFYLKVEARGNGVLYFVVENIVTARKNRRTETAALTPVYVGPGANADDLEVTLSDEDIPAGDSVLVTGTAFQNEAVVPGTPIGFVSSQPTVVLVRRVAINQVWLIAAPTAPEGSVPVTVSGPNGLSEEFTVNVIGSAPAGLHFVAVSSQSQNGVANQPVVSVPRVRLLDENNAAVPNAAITFVTTAGGGTITDSVATTNAQGEAALGTWRLGTLAGAYAVNATATGVTALQFTAQAGPTALASLVRISGDSQTAATNTALAQPLVIEARDTFANPLAAGPMVSWTATDGTITPSSQLDAQGRAQASWTLGGSQAAPTATATLNSVTTIFSATTTFPNPTIQLAFSGIPDVGIGLMARVRVTLTTPAPPGGTVVALTSDQPGFATVPASVTVAAGQTVDSFLVTGVAAGDAIVSGSAAGYVTGNITVNVQLRNLNPSLTISVPYGQTTSLPITIPSPAPAGGITISVVSSNPTQVGVATPAVTIAAGGTSTSATLQGLLPGQSTITVTNPAYNTGSSTATTAAALNFAPTTLGINGSFGGGVDLDFVSNNVPIAAPAPGVTVTATVTTGPVGCVSVTPNPATIATGLTSATINFAYAGSATLPCSARVLVTAPNIAADSITVSVAVPPVIAASNVTVGAGLMTTSSISLGASNHGGMLLSVVSLDPSIARPAPNTITLPVDSLGISIPLNTPSTSYVIHGVSPGTASFVAKGNGFVPDTFTITVATPAVDIQNLATTSTTFSLNDDFNSRVGVPNAGNTALSLSQAVAFGQPPLTVTFTSGTPTVGRLVSPTEPGAASVTAEIAPGQLTTPSTVASGGVAFDPLIAGTTAITATVPGFTTITAGTVNVTVSAPTISISGTPMGAGLISTQLFGNLSAGNHGGTTVWVKSVNPALLLVSANSATVGTDSIPISMLNGSTSFSYYLHGTGGQTGTAQLVSFAPGFVDDTISVTVQTPIYDIASLLANFTDQSANDAFAVRVGVGTTAINQAQVIRPGGTPLVATITSSNAPVGDLVTSALTADAVTVTIPVGSSASGTVANGGVEFDPVSAGTTTVSASIPGLTAVAAATQNVTVTSTPINLSPTTVGSGLMLPANGSLGGNGQHGGVAVVLKSLNPAVAQLAPNATTIATDSITLNLANGAQNLSYVVHGIDGVNDSTPLVAYAPGFTPDTVMIRVPQGAVDVGGLLANMQTSAANDPFVVRVGVPSGTSVLSQVQSRRFGGAPLAATISNSNGAIADLVTTALTADQVTATIAAGSSSTPTTVATGGVEFDPLAPGTTSVSVSIPGYLSITASTASVTIAAPAINMSAVTVGAGLMQTTAGSLASGTHPTDSVTITSSQPSVLLLAPNVTTLPTASIKVAIPTGQTAFNFVMVGVEGQTGSALVTAQFPGFTDGTTTGEVRQAGIDIGSANSVTTTTSVDDPFIIRVGWAQAGNTGLGQVQPIRFGGTALTATVTSSNQAVGAVKTSADSGASVTVAIPVGSSFSASTVALGGVAFDPLTAGTTTIAVSGPGYVTQTTSSFAITVNTPTITISAQTVGGGLMTTQIGGSLSGPVPAGGLTLTLTSANPATVLVAPDLITTGTGQITIPLAAGATSFSYVVAAPFGVTGTANVTATMPGFTGDTRLVTVVQPAFDLVSLTQNQTVAAANDEFAFRVGIPNALNTALQTQQQVRWGGTQLAVTVNNSNATAAQLVTTAGAGQSRTIPVNVGANTTPMTVAAGGVSFDGLAAGTTTVSATIPGFIVLPSSSLSVTVSP